MCLGRCGSWDIDKARRERAPELQRIVVAIDPAVSSHEGSDETGLVVCGKDERGHGYVLEDLSGKYSPDEWARAAISAYHRHGADRIVAEVNQGGAMVEATLRMVDASIPYTAVTASRGKYVRAEPVAAMYQQGRVHHCGNFAELEDQMVSFTADLDRGRQGSPDRLDSAVWGLTELLVERVPFQGLLDFYKADLARWKGEAAGAGAAEAAPSSPVGAAALPKQPIIEPAIVPRIALPAVLRCAPFQNFQALSGNRYEADEAGEIIVANRDDMESLMRAGCKA